LRTLAPALHITAPHPHPIYFGLGYVTQKRWWTVGLIASVLNIIIWSVVGTIWWKVLGWW
jgi:DASS family divalent anion:Na+ symporter